MTTDHAVHAPVRATDVAAALLTELGPMTAMKLQKLLYYVQAWHLARFGTRAFAEQIEAWKDGPVVKAVWSLNAGSRQVSSVPEGDGVVVTGTRREVVCWVADSYGGFSAEQLSAMTHTELPWLVARQTVPDGAPSNNPLSDSVMKNFYARQTLTPAEAVESAAASAALEGAQISPEWQEAVLKALDDPRDIDALIARRLRESGVHGSVPDR